MLNFVWELTLFRAFGIILWYALLKFGTKAGETVAERDSLRFRKGDWLAIAVVAALAVAVLLCFLPGGKEPAAQAEIYLDGELYRTLSLEENTVFQVADAYTNEITVKDGTIAFTASNCPGQDCVHSGSIRSTGRSLVCLPNKVEIRVVAGESDVDFVVG